MLLFLGEFENPREFTLPFARGPNVITELIECGSTRAKAHVVTTFQQFHRRNDVESHPGAVDVTFGHLHSFLRSEPAPNSELLMVVDLVRTKPFPGQAHAAALNHPPPS